MQEDLKIHISSVGATLATAIAVGCLFNGLLGTGLFSTQLTGVLIITCWAPYLYVRKITSRISTPLAVILISIALFCFVPVFHALILNLFMGHRVPGATWVDAVWRIYAILGLWMAISVVIERYVRPFWASYSPAWLVRARENSVSGQTERYATERRASSLASFRQRMGILVRRKKALEASVKERSEEAVEAEMKLKNELAKLTEANVRVLKCEKDDVKEAEEIVNAQVSVVENNRNCKEELDVKIRKLKVDLQLAASDVEVLQQEYTEALHINNHIGFYR